MKLAKKLIATDSQGRTAVLELSHDSLLAGPRAFFMRFLGSPVWSLCGEGAGILHSLDS